MLVRLSVILLAAGLSRRMGSDKLLMPYHGKLLIHYAYELLMKLPVDERIVITTQERLRHFDVPGDVRVYINPNPSEGVSGSVRMGVQNAGGTHFLFLLADQPRLTAGDIAPLIELAKNNPDKIIYPSINGKPCNPAIFPSAFSDELMALRGDKGGRVIRDMHPELCLAYTPKRPERFRDVDRFEDLGGL